MSGPKIAKSTSANGPDDELIVVDVYDEDGSEVANKYQETHPDAIDVLDGLDGSDFDGKKKEGDFNAVTDLTGLQELSPNNDLSDILGDSPLTELDSVSDAELDEWLSGGNFDILSELSSLGDNIKAGLRSGLGALDDIYADMNGVVTQIQGAIDPRSIHAIKDLLNKVGCGDYNPNIVYRGSTIGMLSGLINLASRLGLPSVFTAIANCISDPQILTGVVKNVAIDAVKRANLDVIKDIANSPVAKEVISTMPNVVGGVVRDLGRPTYLQQEQYGSYYGQARDAFTSIDSQWNSITRIGEQTYDSTVVASNNFFRDTLGAATLSYPIDVNINSSPTSLDSVVSVNYGLSPNAPVKQSTEDATAYLERAQQSRQSDQSMYVSSALSAQTVASALSKSFSEVGAKLTRSIFA